MTAAAQSDVRAHPDRPTFSYLEVFGERVERDSDRRYAVVEPHVTRAGKVDVFVTEWVEDSPLTDPKLLGAVKEAKFVAVADFETGEVWYK